MREPSTCSTVSIRGLDYNIRRWGRADAAPILMVHGARDSSITFQFVVDHLSRDWQVVAPDWRGHGQTAWAEAYWLHDFVADLSAIVDLLFPGQSVPLVGHSLGGNVAGVYAGLRPDRVSHLISLDGFGPLVNAVPVDPARLLLGLLDTGTPAVRRYPDVASMAGRLQRANKRLSAERARFLAEHSSTLGADGLWRWRHADDFQRSLPSLHSLAEWARIWVGITAPALWVLSSDHRANSPTNDPDEMARRAAFMKRVEQVQIPETGHNLHHDAPEQVAALIERFLTQEHNPPVGAACEACDA